VGVSLRGGVADEAISTLSNRKFEIATHPSDARNDKKRPGCKHIPSRVILDKIFFDQLLNAEGPIICKAFWTWSKFD
jgi:hypothetical protein